MQHKTVMFGMRNNNSTSTRALTADAGFGTFLHHTSVNHYFMDKTTLRQRYKRGLCCGDYCLCTLVCISNKQTT